MINRVRNKKKLLKIISRRFLSNIDMLFISINLINFDVFNNVLNNVVNNNNKLLINENNEKRLFLSR